MSTEREDVLTTGARDSASSPTPAELAIFDEQMSWFPPTLKFNLIGFAPQHQAQSRLKDIELNLTQQQALPQVSLRSMFLTWRYGAAGSFQFTRWMGSRCIEEDDGMASITGAPHGYVSAGGVIKGGEASIYCTLSNVRSVSGSLPQGADSLCVYPIHPNATARTLFAVIDARINELAETSAPSSQKTLESWLMTEYQMDDDTYLWDDSGVNITYRSPNIKVGGLRGKIAVSAENEEEVEFDIEIGSNVWTVLTESKDRL